MKKIIFNIIGISCLGFLAFGRDFSWQLVWAFVLGMMAMVIVNGTIAIVIKDEIRNIF